MLFRPLYGWNNFFGLIIIVNNGHMIPLITNDSS